MVPFVRSLFFILVFTKKRFLFHGCFGYFKTRFCLTVNLSMAYLFSEWLVQTSWPHEKKPIDLMHDITLIRHCDMKLIFFISLYSANPVKRHPVCQTTLLKDYLSVRPPFCKEYLSVRPPLCKDCLSVRPPLCKTTVRPALCKTTFLLLCQTSPL